MQHRHHSFLLGAAGKVVDVGAGREEPRRQVADQHRTAHIAVPADLVDGRVQVVEKGAVVRVRGWAIEMNERDSVGLA